MQNVLVVTSGLSVGGAEKMLVNIVNRLDHNLFCTTVVSLNSYNPLAKEILPEAAEVIELPRKWRWDLSPAESIHDLIRTRKIDVILCFGLYEFLFVHWSLRQLQNSPQVIISIHSTQLSSWKQYAQFWSYARLLTGKEQFISVCDAQANYWSRAYMIPRGQFKTIYNGIDTQFFKPFLDQANRVAFREQHAIPSNAIVIALVATFRPVKGHEDALLALQKLLYAQLQNLPYLMLIGNGTPRREVELRDMAQSLGIADRVIFCGSQQDVRPFYDAADLFTLTSNSETFSVAALEAMAMGLPCVLTNLSGAREMVIEGINGYIVPPRNPQMIAEGWLRVIKDLQKFDRKIIRERVIQQFTIEDCVRKYERFLSLEEFPDGQ